jgi:2-polyprenyl-3-methyl-5-hydroxy-6-metoxy-1,4-benzoquinol methylase
VRRETTNRIRFAIEELLPPIVRDSFLFRNAAKIVWGSHIDRLAEFRARAPFLDASEYEALYRDHPRVHHDTDNSTACLELITAYVAGDTLCDVGCGTGHLLRHIRNTSERAFKRLVGVDFVLPAGISDPDIEFREAMIEKLPFAERAFDTVLCTHVLEHILDYRAAIAELRRITRKRLIIVVPRERESIYAFNPHFNFFPYRHSFLRAMIPVPAHNLCLDVGRDIFYMEDHQEAQ